MRWLLSIFRLRQEPPSLREIPEILLKCIVWGMLTGPFWALFFTALTGLRHALWFLTSPIAIFWSSVAGAVFSVSFYVFCGPGNSILRFWVNDLPQNIRVPVVVIYNALACALAFASAAMIVSHLPVPGVRIEIPYFWQILVIDAAFGAVLAVVIGAFMRLKLEVERTQLKAARAQSLALQSQINPHFFFNTLNSISALIDEDPAAAKSMIGRMADMFRYTLGCTHTEAVPLEREIQFVRDYLDIEQARFRERLRVELPMGPFPGIYVPGLVLQPLVENAVKYGIAQSITGGTVSIRVMQSGETARITVGNTSEGACDFESGAVYKTGHALENVRARLRLFTGRSDPLQISTAEGWTEFSFDCGVSAI